MSGLKKSDKDGLMYQKNGLLVNVDDNSFKEYKLRKAILDSKDMEIESLQRRISEMDEKINQVIKEIRDR